MASISLIAQQDDTGCGIACVAMLAQTSYKCAKEAVAAAAGWSKAKQTFYTKAPILRKALADLGIDACVRESRSWNDITGTAIVGVNREKRANFHWVLVVKNASRFAIVDPEYGDVYQGNEWADDEEGYVHSARKSQYVSVKLSINRIEI